MQLSRNMVVSVRLDHGAIQVLDLLVDAGVAKSRSEASARFVQIGIEASGDLLRQVRDVANQAQALRQQLDSAAGNRTSVDEPGGEGVTKHAGEGATKHVGEGAIKHAGERATKQRGEVVRGDEIKDEPTEAESEVRLPYRRAVEVAKAAKAVNAARDRLNVFEAVAVGDRDRMLALIRDDPNVLKMRDENGWTPLHLAGLLGKFLCAISLISAGADVEARSANILNCTPLHAAVSGRSCEIADSLVISGADVNARQTGGWTPLHQAAFYGDSRMIARLLVLGAAPSLRTNRGETAFDIAMKHGRRQIAEFLTRRSRFTPPPE